MTIKKAFIYPTMRCNLKCSFCYTSSPTKQAIKFDEITLEEYEKIVGDLYQNGVRVFDMSGGEPLFRSDLIDICKVMKSYPDVKVYITSNGTQVARNKEKVEELLQYVDKFNISLDSTIPEQHDKLRGVKNTFQRAMEGIRIVSEIANEKLAINFVLNLTNQDDLLNMVELCRREKVSELAVLFPRDVAANELSKFYPTYEGYKQILDNLVGALKKLQGIEQELRVWMMMPASLFPLISQLEEEHNFSQLVNPKLVLEVDPFRGCSAFKDFIAIKVDGTVIGCPFMTNFEQFSIGNIREVGTEEILKRCEDMRKVLKQRSKCLRKSEKCSQCDIVAVCQGGCPAMSLSHVNDSAKRDLICDYIKQ